MAKDAENLSRDERLAARLRDNLKRRKAQARAIAQAPDAQDNRSLPKAPPKS